MQELYAEDVEWLNLGAKGIGFLKKRTGTMLIFDFPKPAGLHHLYITKQRGNKIKKNLVLSIYLSIYLFFMHNYIISGVPF